MEENTNWNFGVGGVVLRGNKILLVRHTYGAAKGKLLIPGGYVHNGEMPEAAVIREIREETNVITTIRSLISIRFQTKNWYAIFLLDYVSGEPKSDSMENDFVDFIPLGEAMRHDDVTGLSRVIIEAVIKGVADMPLNDYFSGESRSEYTLYGL